MKAKEYVAEHYSKPRTNAVPFTHKRKVLISSHLTNPSFQRENEGSFKILVEVHAFNLYSHC